VDRVLHLHPFGRPLGGRQLALDAVGDRVHPLLGQAGDDLVVVDQQGRALVSQTGAGAGRHADPSVRPHRARRHPQAPAQALHQGHAAQHAVGDVVAEQHPVLAHRGQVQKAVEAGHALDIGHGAPGGLGNGHQGLAGQPALLRLQFSQDLHEGLGLVGVARQHGADGGFQGHGDVGKSGPSMLRPEDGRGGRS
jgi:hypothetical protein